MTPAEVAGSWVDQVHRWFDGWPHRVWVAEGEPPAIVAEAGNYAAEPDPAIFLGSELKRRVRTPTTLYLERQATPGVVVGLSVPPSRSHPLLDPLLDLGAAFYRSQWMLAQQELSMQSIMHEVRGPLTVMAGYAEMLAHRGEVEISPLFLREIDRVEGHLQEFLEAGRPLEFAPVNLSELMRQVADTFQSACTAVGIVVSQRVDPVTVLADAAKLATVFDNLFRNAIEAMPAGGTIRICGRPLPGAAEVLFSDTGPGIPPEVRPRLFEPYVSTKGRGHGVGLALAHDIMVRHAGLLELTSAQDGVTFRVWMPRGTSA